MLIQAQGQPPAELKLGCGALDVIVSITLSLQKAIEEANQVALTLRSA